MNKMPLILAVFLAICLMACGDSKSGTKNPLDGSIAEEHETTNDDVGIDFSGEMYGAEGVISGASGKNRYLPASHRAPKAAPAFKPMAIYWPDGLNRIDAYGIMESVTSYTHFDAVTDVTLPRSYANVPIGFPESAGFLVNGMPRVDITWTPSTNPAGALTSGSFCLIGGSSGDAYYPDEMFGVGQAMGIVLRDNNGPESVEDFFPTGAFAPLCGRSFYRVTLEIIGDDLGGDPITATTIVRAFSTQSWDVTVNDFPLYTIVTSNVTANGRLWTIYVISGAPTLIKPEYDTANPFATWRIAPIMSIDALDLWDPATGTFVNQAACTGTVFTGAFDLDEAIGVGNTDEGYLASFDHTVASCLTQTSTGFTVVLQAPTFNQPQP